MLLLPRVLPLRCLLVLWLLLLVLSRLQDVVMCARVVSSGKGILQCHEEALLLTRRKLASGARQVELQVGRRACVLHLLLLLVLLLM